MFDLQNDLGVKSFSFRSIKENADVAQAVLQCGVNSVDLSGCHIDYDDPAAQAAAIATYRDAGVRISGIGVVQLKNDEAFNRRYFDFAQQAGCEVVSVNFQPAEHESVLAMLERLCDGYGMRAAIHNHGGKHWMGNATMIDYMLQRSSKAVGLCLDTAWCIQAGEDPVNWLEKYGDRLYAIHFKDFTFEPNGQFHDTVVGEGALDIAATLDAFLALPFDGSAVIEYEGDDAVEASRQCVEAIRAYLATKGVGANQ